MLKRTVALIICFFLVFEQAGFAQVAGPLGVPNYLANLLPAERFRPLHLRSLSFDPEKNNFDLLLDRGDTKSLAPEQLQSEAEKLMQYFRIGLALPNSAFWVNLRPDAPTDVIDASLEKTDIGKVMLEADLQLKKDIAAFTSPDTREGKEYWDKLYAQAEALFGPANVNIPTLTRPWIVPGEIIIRQGPESAYIYKATLNVMLEQDYLKDSVQFQFDDARIKQLNNYSSELVRKIILPKLVRAVNSSKRYAALRQVYYSLILAQWYKSRWSSGEGKNVAPAELTDLIDSGNLGGLISKQGWSKDVYFSSYKKSFAKGEYNRQENVYGGYGLSVRRYFSGGADLGRIVSAISATVLKTSRQPHPLGNEILAPLAAMPPAQPVPARPAEKVEPSVAAFDAQRASFLLDQISYYGDDIVAAAGQKKDPRAVIQRFFKRGTFFVQNNRHYDRTSVCSGRCWFCFAHRMPLRERLHQTEPVDLKAAAAVVSKAIESGFETIQINGEDTLDDLDSFWEVLEACKDKPIGVSFITNGFYLLEHSADAKEFFQQVKSRVGNVQRLGITLSWDPDKVSRAKNFKVFSGNEEEVYRAMALIIHSFNEVFPNEKGMNALGRKYSLSVDAHDLGTASQAQAQKRYDAFHGKLHDILETSYGYTKKSWPYIHQETGSIVLMTPESVEKAIAQERVVTKFSTVADLYRKMSLKQRATCGYDPFYDMSMGEMVTCIRRQEYPRRRVSAETLEEVILKPFSNPRSRHLYLGSEQQRKAALLAQLGWALAVDPGLAQEMRVSFEEVEAFIFSNEAMMAKIEMLYLLDDIFRQQGKTASLLFGLESVPEELAAMLRDKGLLEAFLRYYAEISSVAAPPKAWDIVGMYGQGKKETAVDALDRRVQEIIARLNSERSLVLTEAGETPAGFSKSAVSKNPRQHLPGRQADFKQQLTTYLSSFEPKQRAKAFSMLETLVGEEYDLNRIKDAISGQHAPRSLSDKEAGLFIELIKEWANQSKSIERYDLGLAEQLLMPFVLQSSPEAKKKALEALLDVDEKLLFGWAQVDSNKKKRVISAASAAELSRRREELLPMLDKVHALQFYRKLLEYRLVSESEIARDTGLLSHLSAAKGALEEIGRWGEKNEVFIPALLDMLSLEKTYSTTFVIELLEKTSKGRQAIREAISSGALSPGTAYLDALNVLLGAPGTARLAKQKLNALPMPFFEQRDIFVHMSHQRLYETLLPHHAAPQMRVMIDCLSDLSIGTFIPDALSEYLVRTGRPPLDRQALFRELEAAEEKDGGEITDKTLDIGAVISERTAQAVRSREVELEKALADQEVFVPLRALYASQETRALERALARRIFAVVIGKADSLAAGALHEALKADLGDAKAREAVRVVLDGRLDEPESGLSPAERKAVYNALFVKAPVWKGAQGQLRTFFDAVFLAEGLKEQYFGRSGEAAIELYFGATEAEFILELVRQEKRVAWWLSDIDDAIIAQRYAGRSLGGKVIPYQDAGGRRGSRIIVNLGVDGFAKVLSSILHETAHSIIDDLSGEGISVSSDAGFINEGTAEDFAVFALEALSRLYEDDPAFRIIAKRRQARILKQKLGLHQYRYGYLFAETARQRTGKNFAGLVGPEMLKAVKGQLSVLELSRKIDQWEDLAGKTDGGNMDEAVARDFRKIAVAAAYRISPGGIERIFWDNKFLFIGDAEIQRIVNQGSGSIRLVAPRERGDSESSFFSEVIVDGDLAVIYWGGDRFSREKVLGDARAALEKPLSGKDGGEGISPEQYLQLIRKVAELRAISVDLNALLAKGGSEGVMAVPAFDKVVSSLSEERIAAIQRNLEEGSSESKDVMKLSGILAGVMERMNPTAAAYNVGIMMPAAGIDIIVNKAEAKALAEAITELVNNAIKYSYPQGSAEKKGKNVIVAAEKLNNGKLQVQISVIDQGIGLLDEQGNFREDFWNGIVKTVPSPQAGRRRKTDASKGVYSGSEGLGLVKYFVEDVLNNKGSSGPLLFARKNPAGGSTLGFVFSQTNDREYEPREWENILMALGQSSRHDLKNLLFMISGYVGLALPALKEASAPQEYIELTAKVEELCREMYGILNASAKDGGDIEIMSGKDYSVFLAEEFSPENREELVRLAEDISTKYDARKYYQAGRPFDESMGMIIGKRDGNKFIITKLAAVTEFEADSKPDYLNPKKSGLIKIIESNLGPQESVLGLYHNHDYQRLVSNAWRGPSSEDKSGIANILDIPGYEDRISPDHLGLVLEPEFKAQTSEEIEQFSAADSPVLLYAWVTLNRGKDDDFRMVAPRGIPFESISGAKQDGGQANKEAFYHTTAMSGTGEESINAVLGILKEGKIRGKEGEAGWVSKGSYLRPANPEKQGFLTLEIDDQLENKRKVARDERALARNWYKGIYSRQANPDESIDISEAISRGRVRIISFLPPEHEKVQTLKDRLTEGGFEVIPVVFFDEKREVKSGDVSRDGGQKKYFRQEDVHAALGKILMATEKGSALWQMDRQSPGAFSDQEMVEGLLRDPAERESILEMLKESQPQEYARIKNMLDRAEGLFLAGMVGRPFDREAIEKEGSSGLFVFERMISSFEKVIAFEKKAFIVFVSGSGSGNVYRIVERPSRERMQAAPSMQDILAEVDRRLEEISRKENPEERYDLAGKLHTYLLKAYDGNEHVAGLKELELFDQQAQYEEFLSRIRTGTLQSWLESRAREKGLRGVSLSAMEHSPQVYRYYYAKEKSGSNRYQASRTARKFLSHGTYSEALPGIISRGKLVSASEVKGEPAVSRGKEFYDPTQVYFWFSLGSVVKVEGGYGQQRGFGFPMMFAIAISSANARIEEELDSGKLEYERTAQEISLKEITHVFVPFFAVEEVKTVFAQHGYASIEVLPLGMADNGKPIDPSVRDGGEQAGKEKDPGGIDFRALPIVAEPDMQPSPAMLPQAVNPLVVKELEKEWDMIAEQVKSGQVPFDKLKNYASSCRSQNCGQQMEQVLACIAGILRLEEECAVQTPPELKEVLAALG